jgi:chromate transporter
VIIILGQLFFTFFKIGLFTFGGGYAMIPMIESICVEQHGWITHNDMMNVTVIAESTPGPIAINCATFVGHKKAGMAGAIAATLGAVLPSFVIIYLISMFLDSFLSISIIANAFKGIKVGVGILILRAGLNMGKKLPKNNLTRVITLCSLSVMLLVNIFSLKISTITLMLAAGIVGISAAVCRKDGADV